MATLFRPEAKTVSRSDPCMWTLERKVALVLEGLRGFQPVAVLCREAGISASRYYQWRARFLEGGRDALAQSEVERGNLEEHMHQLEAENSRLRVEKEIILGAAIED